MSWFTSYFWSTEEVRKPTYDKQKEFAYEISESGWIKLWFREEKKEVIFNVSQILEIHNVIEKRRRVIKIELKSTTQKEDGEIVKVYANQGREFYNKLQKRLMGFV